MADYFLVTRGCGPAWDHGRGRREQEGWDEHAAFMDSLVDEGFVVLGGPVGEADGDEVLLVVDAESEPALRERLADDPWGPDMLTTESVRPWLVWLRPAAPLTLEIKRVLPAASSVVFRAFSTSEELARWWGPEGFTAPSLEFDPRVGDSYRIQMQPPEGEPFHLTGEFREVDPPARLTYTFVWEDPDPDDLETLVELSFRDLGESTEVVLTQRAFKTEARRELHRNGWMDSFDKLEQLILRT